MFLAATPQRRHLPPPLVLPESPPARELSNGEPGFKPSLCVNLSLFLPLALRWGAGIWGEDEEGEGSSVCLGLIRTPSLSFCPIFPSVIRWSRHLLAKLGL